ISPNQYLSPKPTIFICGDRVSDLLAANSADCWFVKFKGGSRNDLAKIRLVRLRSFLDVRRCSKKCC
ncbi:hypothetical protein PPACK8108_LOCUS24347, partial [Phakopsora pachyrhizi]